MEQESNYIEEIKTGGSDAVLASLFRGILMDLGITNTRFEKLLDRYISKSGVPVSLKESSSRRGNLKKELLKSTMTWKVFIKAMVFLNVKRIVFSVELHHCNDQITKHKKSVVLTNYLEEEEDAD